MNFLLVEFNLRDTYDMVLLKYVYIFVCCRLMREMDHESTAWSMNNLGSAFNYVLVFFVLVFLFSFSFGFAYVMSSDLCH